MNTFDISRIRQIGAGGLGVVDEVEVTRSFAGGPLIGTRLAHKRLNSKWAGDVGALGRFAREIDIMKKLNHPHIVILTGTGLPGHVTSYTMPLFQQSLRDLLLKNSLHDFRIVAGFGANLASALLHAHQANVAHRDLKPENVLIHDGMGFIADWGVGQFIHKQSTVLQFNTTGAIGTQHYCSIKQWSTGDGGTPGDVYSLGMVLGELVFGAPVPMSLPGSGITFDVIVGATTASELAFNQLMREMTNVHDANRPSMMEVEQRLSEI